jgi:chemotaxis protein CheD
VTQQAFVVKLLPGQYYVTAGYEVLITVLGSCVSACIRDPIRGVGGMNHFMLPQGQPGGEEGGLQRLAHRAVTGDVELF